MKLQLQCVIQRIIILVLLISSSAVSAITIKNLANQNALSIETWLTTQIDSNRTMSTPSNSENKGDSKAQPLKLITAALGQQITLNIKVGTNSRFTRGTVISNVELPNVMSRQREQFAVNSTQKINGETWSFQLWQVSLLPQASGIYEVPALNLNVEVLSSTRTKIAGQIFSQPQRFEAILPDATLTNNNWFSSPKVIVKQLWKQSNSELYVGDSITRSITISASDTLSVLLPNSLKQIENKQFQVYKDPVQLQDTEQRGDYLSSRTDRQTYIVQQGGKLVFPDVKVRWWDTTDKKMKQQILAGQSVMVKHTLSSWLHYYRTILIVMSCLIIGLIILIFITIKHYQQHAKPLWWLYINAVKAKSWPQVHTLLYKRVRQTNQHLTLSKGINKNHQQQAQEIQSLSDSSQTDHVKRSLFSQLWFAVAIKDGQKQQSMIKRLKTILLPKALPALNKKFKNWG